MKFEGEGLLRFRPVCVEGLSCCTMMRAKTWTSKIMKSCISEVHEVGKYVTSGWSRSIALERRYPTDKLSNH